MRTIYDPTAGTGGMLSGAGEYLTEMNPQARLAMFGQELNDESYAICKADMLMLIKGQDVTNITPGNTLSDDGHPTRKFDYMLSTPPFGVEWKKVEKEVRREHDAQGHSGRHSYTASNSPDCSTGQRNSSKTCGSTGCTAALAVRVEFAIAEAVDHRKNRGRHGIFQRFRPISRFSPEMLQAPGCPNA